MTAVAFMRVGIYARVSRDDGEMEPLNQIIPLRAFCREHGWTIAREYVDRASAGDLRGRTAWRDLMADAERGRFETLLCLRLDRCFRSVAHAVDSLARLEEWGVALKSLTEAWADGTTPQGKLMRTIILGFAEFERELIRARTREGVARARAQGKRLGRPRRLNGEFEKICADVLAGRISQREAARRLGVSARTIARTLRHNGGPIGLSQRPVNQGPTDPASRK